MLAILALGLAAAVYPQLLAVVVVILTRPGAKRLLWACYTGCLTTSIGCGLAVLFVFRDRGSVAGSTSHRLGPSAYLVIGVIALVIALLVATERGRRLVGGVPRLPARRERDSADPGFLTQQKSRAQDALLRGSSPVAVVVGVALGIPGPFDLLALGRVVRGAYAVVPAIALLIIFNLVKFLLLEIPIASYAVDPAGTAVRVDRLSAWLKTHRMTLIGGVVGVIGLALVGRGISRLG